MKKKLTVAIVGAGYMAKEHLKAFNALIDVKLVGIHSRTKEKAEALAKQFHIDHVCDSISDLYKKTNADLVVVATPELETKNVCNELFNYSWISLIEKPVGYTFEEAAMLANKAKELNHQAFVALNRRHYSSTIALIDDLSQDDQSRVLNIVDQEDIINAQKSGQPQAVLNNWMYANAIHIIDYIPLFLRGNVVSVENVVRWNPDNPYHVLSKIGFSSGDLAVYQCFWNAPGPWSVSLTTKRRRWELRPLENLAYQDFGQRKAIPVEIAQDDVEFKPGLLRQAKELLKAFRREEHHLPSLSDALNSMELTKRIYEL